MENKKKCNCFIDKIALRNIHDVLIETLSLCNFYPTIKHLHLKRFHKIDLIACADKKLISEYVRIKYQIYTTI